MSRSVYYTGQYVSADDLNNTESASISRILNQTQLWLGDSGGYSEGFAAVARGGILGSPLDYLDGGMNLYPSKVSSTEINIARGDALSVSGELVRIEEPQSILYGEGDSWYSWPTGSINTTNYIKIAYRESSGSFLFNRFGSKEPRRYIASYYITVDATYPTASELLLGTFQSDYTTGQISGDITDRRLYVSVIAPSDSVLLDPTVSPISSHTSFHDHAIAVGSGTPSTTNPHGTSYADIGAAPASSSLSLSRLNSGSVVLDYVYENTNAVVYYVASAIEELYRADDAATAEMYLQIGSTGSAGSSGTLAGVTYNLSYFKKYNISGGGGYDDGQNITTSVRGFVPPGWFWRISRDNPTWNSGSIQSSIRHE